MKFMTKMITLQDFLNEDQINICCDHYKKLKGTGKFAATVAKEVIEPNIEAINKKIGQENDPKYLAYCVEYAFMR